MSRLLLNAEDLSKLRVRPWGPFSEALFSLRMLHGRRPSPFVDPWLAQVRAGLGRVATPLLAITPACPFVDLHTVVGEAAELGDALDRLEGAPADHLRSELACLPSQPNRAWADVWVRHLSDGNLLARGELVELFRTYHRRAIQPYWPAIRTHLEAERARRGQVMAAAGIDGLLNTLHPLIRWRPPFLDVGETGDSSGRRPPEPTVLDGRSVVLVPSVFGHDAPHVLHSMGDRTTPYVVTYPALHSLDDAMRLWANDARPTHQALSDLLGRTRARALEVIAETCTTTELARRLGVSAGTASHHVGALRQARLITSVREGTSVRHRIVARGAALLDGHPAQD